MQTHKSNTAKNKSNPKLAPKAKSTIKKPTKPAKAETLHFVLHGSTITSSIRNFCLDGNPSKAWSVFASLTPSETAAESAVEIFRNIIKGTQAFEGTSDLSLITPTPPNDAKLVNTTRDPSFNLTLDIIHNIRRAKKEEIGPSIFSRFLADTNQDEGDFEEGMSESEIKERNEQICKDEESRLKELNFFLSKMNITPSQAEEMMLKDHASENYANKDGGWVTDRGQYITVEHEQHENTLDALITKGYILTGSGIRDMETKWVRVTKNEHNSERMLMRLAGADTLTAKQKMTIEKIIRAMNLLKEGGMSLYILSAYGKTGYCVSMDNDVINFKKQNM